MAAGWLAVSACAAVGFVYFSEIKEATRIVLRLPPPAAAAGPPAAKATLGRVVELKAGAHGHYYARAELNGRFVDVMVDTGASIVALTWEDARAAGLSVRDSDFTHRVNTANGIARIAPVTIDRITIGNITVRNVPAAVSEPGSLTTSLLGMSFLGRLQRVDMRPGLLVLQE